MNINIEYITDNKGKYKAVVIPYKQWKSLIEEHNMLKNKLNIILGIQDALKEVNEIRSGKRKGKTLNSLLNEL
jgi:hypothetical protein